jgi:type VI secretion system protein ImpJ
MNAKTSAVLRHFLSELLQLQQHRIQSIASRLSVAGKSSLNEMTDFMMLQTLNRYLPLLRQFDHCEHIKPYSIYTTLVSLIGEMSTFIQTDKMVPELPYYLHGDLSSVFQPIMKTLRELFSVVLEQNAINIELEERKFGIRVGTIADKSLFSHASFILAVGADVSPDELRKNVPGQIKIGAVESIKELVNLQLPGIQINHLPAAPRDIPYQRHCVYFELVQSGEYWQNLSVSGGIACHLSQPFPNLTLELWAIRN